MQSKEAKSIMHDCACLNKKVVGDRLSLLRGCILSCKSLKNLGVGEKLWFW